jgi:3-methylfumaryl-CoA hydratase
MSIDIAYLRSWVGKSESRTDIVSATSVQGLAALLDHDETEPRIGSAVPACWHWLYSFTPVLRQSALGADGHPKRGGFLPPVPLPRRMWAGSTIDFRNPLRVGEALQRRSTIVDVSAKTGRSGALVFVRVRHEIGNGAELCLVEQQDIVYREQPNIAEPRAAARPAAAVHDFARAIQPDSTLLFRYSALTHNAHRIHYDRPYAVEIEGYPGLVVHGPLIATLLVDLLRRSQPDAELAEFSFRAVTPIFDTAPFQLCGRVAPDRKTVVLWAQTPDGSLAMDARAVLR